jgi:hypothetical protein
MNMKMTVTLSKDEVLKIVADYVAKETGKTVTRSNIEVGIDYEDRPAGSSYPVFKKITVDIE